RQPRDDSALLAVAVGGGGRVGGADLARLVPRLAGVPPGPARAAGGPGVRPTRGARRGAEPNRPLAAEHPTDRPPGVVVALGRAGAVGAAAAAAVDQAAEALAPTAQTRSHAGAAEELARTPSVSPGSGERRRRRRHVLLADEDAAGGAAVQGEEARR